MPHDPNSEDLRARDLLPPDEVENDPELVKTAPHSTRVRRVDETLAARKPKLRWRPEDEAASESAAAD